MNYIALEFDDQRIRVAAARLVAKRVRFKHAFTIDIAQDNDQQAAEKLKQSLAQHRVGKADALVIVKRSSVEIRELNLPPAPDDELPEMVRFVARTEFASLNDHWLLDFVPLSKDAAAPRKVLASGLSPERQKQILKITEAAGLKVKHILLRPFESFSLLLPHLTPGKRSLIVDLGDTQVDMMISVDRNVVATRTVRVADAGSETRTHQILSEVKRTAVSSETVLGNQPIEEVILLGDSSNDATLAAGIREQMQVEARIVKPFDLVDVDMKEIPQTDAAQYSALLGSLLQQAAGTRHAIDFLNPRRPIVRTDGRKKLMIYGGLAAGIALAAAAIGLWILRSQSQEIAELENKVQQLVDRNNGTNNQSGVEQILGEVKAIDSWRFAGINWLDELYENSQRFLTPDDAIVDVFDASLRDRVPSMSIKGRVANSTREKLYSSLIERPYQIKPESWKAEDQDPDYPEPYDFTVTFEVKEEQQLKATDLLADQHFQRQRNLRFKN